MRYLIFTLLSIYLHQGLTAPAPSMHIDRSILEHYQKNEAQTILKPQRIDEEINKLYAQMPRQIVNTPNRLDYFSQHYLNTPYILFPLGEGHPSQYDEMPRVRLDGFDCQTYVDTTLALTLADNATHFKQCLDQLRYRDGIVSFVTRNHFTSLDWNTNNQRKGYLSDITLKIVDEKNQPIAEYAQTTIDKASWYKKLPLKRIRVFSLTQKQQVQRLNALRHEGRNFKPKQVSVPYLPIDRLLDKQGQLHPLFSKQIPSGAIIEIVRPHWHLKEIIGTDLDISHIGFAFWKDEVLYFREASSAKQRVIDIPLGDYLREASKNPTIGGINIQVLKIKTPLPVCS